MGQHNVGLEVAAVVAVAVAVAAGVVVGTRVGAAVAVGDAYVAIVVVAGGANPVGPSLALAPHSLQDEMRQ